MRNEEECHNSPVQPTSRPAHLFCRPNPSSPLPARLPRDPPLPRFGPVQRPGRPAAPSVPLPLGLSLSRPRRANPRGGRRANPSGGRRRCAAVVRLGWARWVGGRRADGEAASRGEGASAEPSGAEGRARRAGAGPAVRGPRAHRPAACGRRLRLDAERRTVSPNLISLVCFTLFCVYGLNATLGFDLHLIAIKHTFKNIFSNIAFHCWIHLHI